MDSSFYLKKNQEDNITIDIIIFSIRDNTLQVLLNKKKTEPFKNHYVLPGGFINKNYDLETNALEILKRDTNIQEVYLEQLYTFGDISRDPRKRIISITYLALINNFNQKIILNYLKFNNVEWIDLKKIDNIKIGFDHKKIIDMAYLRIKNKLEYTNICFQLMDKKFSIAELKKAYEIILQKNLDSRNFSKKILSLDILEETEEFKKKGRMRPARLYRFKKNSNKIFNMNQSNFTK